MKKYMTISFLTVIAACAAPLQNYVPAVSQYNGDSVTIQVDSTANLLSESDRSKLKETMQLKANEICRRGHAKRAEYTSQITRSTGQYTGVIERLYLCLK